jgi:diacylglycerol kinase (ATP)
MTQRVGVLINRASGRGNGKGNTLAERLQGVSDISLHVLDGFAALHAALEILARENVSDLFISSGDGTVQAVMTHLAESGKWKSTPRLCVLPHGTTNLSAGDIGFRSRNIATQVNFIKNLPAAKTETRRSLRIVNPKAGSPRHGLTLGAGAAATATRHAQVSYNDKGVRGGFASLATITSGLAKAALTRATPGDDTRLDRPCLMQVEVNGEIRVDGPQLMFMATTLDHLFFKTRPFWGGKNGPIRASVIPYPVPNVLRWAVPLMYGGEDRKVPQGAMSFSGHGFAITCAEPYVMDGEFFEGPLNAPLRVEAGPAFTFITG